MTPKFHKDRHAACTGPDCLWCSPHAALRDAVIGDTPHLYRTRMFRALVRHGITTPEQADDASDEVLLAIKWIAPATLADLRAQLAARRAPKQQQTPAQRLAAAIEAELRRHLGGSALP